MTLFDSHFCLEENYLKMPIKSYICWYFSVDATCNSQPAGGLLLTIYLDSSITTWLLILEEISGAARVWETVSPVTRWAVWGLTSRAPGIGDINNNCKYGPVPPSDWSVARQHWPLIGRHSGCWWREIWPQHNRTHPSAPVSDITDIRDTFQPGQMGSNCAKYLLM